MNQTNKIEKQRNSTDIKLLILKEKLQQELEESMRIEIEQLDEGNTKLASFFNGNIHALTKVIKKLDKLT